MAQVSLDNIVRSYLISKSQPSLHGYLRFLKHCVDCLRKINLNFAILTKTVKMRMDAKKSIPYPDDLLVPVAVFINVGDRIVAIQPDASVATNHSYDADAVSATANDLFSSIINQGASVDVATCSADGSVNGIGYWSYGYMSFNHKAREIQFSSDADSTKDYFLAYRSSGFNPKSRSTVSEVFVNLVENYIAWKEAERKFGKASAEAQACEIAYEKEQNEVVRQLMPISTTMIEAARARSSQFNRLAY